MLCSALIFYGRLPQTALHICTVEQLFQRGFNDRVQTGFSLSNSALKFCYIQKTFTVLRLDVFVLRRCIANHTTSNLARREKTVGRTYIALTELTASQPSNIAAITAFLRQKDIVHAFKNSTNNKTLPIH